MEFQHQGNFRLLIQGIFDPSLFSSFFCVGKTLDAESLKNNQNFSLHHIGFSD
jgi:hypothetical protein